MPLTSILTLQAHKANQQKIVMLTCYDASLSKILNACGVDVILVGDSLGNTIQGHATTLPVKIEDMLYHTSCVAKGNNHCLLLADMPFATYHNTEQAYINASKLMQAGAHMVKLEGGAWLAPIIEYLAARSIPVCAHLGLMPQSVHTLGGFKKQATTIEGANMLKQDALLLQNSGASMVLFEAIPYDVAADVTKQLNVPTIGIGAGPCCDGQVLVINDVLGLTEKPPAFSKNYLNAAAKNTSILDAIQNYVQDVKAGIFPPI
jgi:3-methyl-2-oxobutanoate hydroxymethyltransferase